MTLAYFRHGIGVVGVSHGCCGYQGNRPSQLWLTTDMKHWRDVTPRDADHARFKADHPIFENAWFTDNRTGWVTTWDPGDVEVRIFRTADAGRTWTNVSGGDHTAHAGATLLVQPVSAGVAFKEQLEPTGPGMNLDVSHDDGRHWSTVYDGPPASYHGGPLPEPFMMPMVFTTEVHGFSADGLPSATDLSNLEPSPGYLFVTGNGGRSCTRQNPPRPSIGGSCPREGDSRGKVSCLDGLPTFTNSADGVLPLVTRRYRRVVIGFDVTRDGGSSWRLTSTLNIPLPSIARSPDGGYDFTTPLVSMPSLTTWWVTVPRHDATASWWTSDSGRHWHHNAATLPGTPGALSATSGRSAWLTVDVRLRDGSTTRQLMR
ncbi:MAG: hypothetical protein ACTHK4_10320, partial [Mycobacteriales bacterium]